jgi:syntaxin 5
MAYAASRANAVSEIESNIQELGGIFQQLNLMVMEQGEVVERIDDNLDMTLDNVNAGENELMKYLAGMGGNKWLVFKVLMVLLVFAVFFITFFV